MVAAGHGEEGRAAPPAPSYCRVLLAGGRARFPPPINLRRALRPTPPTVATPAATSVDRNPALAAADVTPAAATTTEGVDGVSTATADDENDGGGRGDRFWVSAGSSGFPASCALAARRQRRSLRRPTAEEPRRRQRAPKRSGSNGIARRRRDEGVGGGRPRSYRQRGPNHRYRELRRVHPPHREFSCCRRPRDKRRSRRRRRSRGGLRGGVFGSGD